MRDIMAGMDEKDSQAVHPCRGAEAVSHHLDCSADHSSSPVAVHVVVDVPVQCCLCSDRGDSTGAVLGSVDDVTVVVQRHCAHRQSV